MGGRFWYTCTACGRDVPVSGHTRVCNDERWMAKAQLDKLGEKHAALCNELREWYKWIHEYKPPDFQMRESFRETFGEYWSE